METPTLAKLLRTLAGIALGVFLGSTVPTVHAERSAHDQDRDRARLLRGPDWNHDRSDDSVWVVNRDKGTVTVFDADTGEVLTSAPVLVGLDEKSGTHDLVVSKRLRKAFIVNETEKTVSVRSASTLELIDTIPIDDTRPHHIKLSPDGKTVYVGLFATNRIAVIDGRTHHVDYYTTSQGSQTPLPLAHAPRPSPDGRLIFVPHEVGNLVTKLSARTGRTSWRASAPARRRPARRAKCSRPATGKCSMSRCATKGRSRRSTSTASRVTGEVTVGAAGIADPHPRRAHPHRQPSRHAGSTGVRQHQADAPDYDDRHRRNRHVRRSGRWIARRPVCLRDVRCCSGRSGRGREARSVATHARDVAVPDHWPAARYLLLDDQVPRAVARGGSRSAPGPGDQNPDLLDHWTSITSYCLPHQAIQRSRNPAKVASSRP